VNFDFVLNDIPFIFKMNTDGEMIWRKTIVKKDTSLWDKAVLGFFFDVEELSNGDLFAVGMWLENPFVDTLINPNKRLVVRLDSEGCVLDQCGEYFTFTDVEDILLAENINIYPNSVSHMALHVNGLMASSQYGYSIFNKSGARFLKGEISANMNKLDVENLTIGIYYLRIHDDTYRFKTLKFIKI
jgi:hypothetical protein